MKSIWNHYEFREFSINSLSASGFLFEFSICFANSLFSSQIHYEYIFYLEIHYEYNNCFANSLFFHDFTRNSSFFSRLIICFANFLWIHYLFREFILNPLFSAKSLSFYYLFRDSTLNSLSYSQNHFFMK